jgi:hypothetical protein
MKNIIQTYFDFKINILVSLTLICFDDEKDNKEFITECLERFYRCYINDIYYHESTTIDHIDFVNEEILKQEFEGVKLELIQELTEKEITIENEEFTHKKELIEKCFEKALVICDFNDFYYEDESKEKYNLMLRRAGIDYVEGKIKFANIIRYSNRREDKFFGGENEFFDLSFLRIDNNFYEVRLLQRIKTLITNYNPGLVNEVFEKEEFSTMRYEVLLQSLVKIILRNVFNNTLNDKYIIRIEDDMFKKGKFKFRKLIDDNIIRENMYLGTSFNKYKERKQFFDNIKFKLVCFEDFSHINNIYDKLNAIETSHAFEYLYIYNYKDKDYQDLCKYSSNTMNIIIRK